MTTAHARLVVTGLGPFTTAMAAGDAHAAHKAAAQAGGPARVVDGRTGQHFHPTMVPGVYRAHGAAPKGPRHAIIIVAQHTPSPDRDATVARLRALLGPSGASDAPAAAKGPNVVADLQGLLAKAGAQPAPQPQRPQPSEIDVAAHEAATSATNNRPQPTGAQRRAGNYKKGHPVVGSMDISIENPQGSVRSGVGPDGKPWAVTMQHHYGYIRGTKGKDKDHVDVFVKPGTPPEMAANAPVFVVDQNKPAGGFDEHKVLIGFRTKREARDAYLANYSAGQEKNIGAITEMPMKKFREWVSGKGPQRGAVARPAAANAA